MRRILLHRISFKKIIIHFFQPRIFIRREHTIRRTAQTQHLAALKNHMVFEGMQAHTQISQLAAHEAIALNRLRLVIMIGKHGLHAELLG